MNLIIFGASDFAQFLTHKAEAEIGSEVVAYVVDDEYCDSDQFNDRPLLPLSKLAEQFRPEAHELIIAVGYKNMRRRKAIYERLSGSGYRLTNLVSASAVVSPSARMGQGNIILDTVVIESDVNIGNNNVIWSGCIVCHDGWIGDHNYLAPRVTLGGKSRVGDACFLGMGSLVADHLHIADETLLAAGSLLLKNTATGTRYQGSPARKVGEHHDAGIKIA